MINLPVARAGERWILKLDTVEYPHLVENETFFPGAARDSGLTVPHFEIVRDAERLPGLLVRRFDRLTLDGVAGSVAVEDGCQACGRSPADKYLLDVIGVVTALAAPCDARVLAARELIRLLAFAYLIGNGDARAKNFSIVAQPDGEWRVSRCTTPRAPTPTATPRWPCRCADVTTPISVRRTSSPSDAISAYLRRPCAASFTTSPTGSISGPPPVVAPVRQGKDYEARQGRPVPPQETRTPRTDHPPQARLTISPRDLDDQAPRRNRPRHRQPRKPIEVKVVRHGARHRLQAPDWLSDQLSPALRDAVVVSTGPHAYRRADGVAVIPACELGS